MKHVFLQNLKNIAVFYMPNVCAKLYQTNKNYSLNIQAIILK